MADIPVVVSSTGYVPQTPAALNNALIASVAAINPGYTANLPGTLIEDISSTDTYALLQCDSSVAEIINSLTPYGANLFLLNQIGNVVGVSPQVPFNTSVYVVFSGPAGWAIAQGFIVSDGTNQYATSAPGMIGVGGTSLPILAVGMQTGAWAVPANTVNQLITSVPLAISLSVNNPTAGTPAQIAETNASFRARTLQANLAASQGMTRYMKTLLQNVPGVQARLVSARMVSGKWEILVGGGDPYQVANAIFCSLFDLITLTGSTMTVSGATNANPAVITTSLNHGYATGQTVTFENMAGGTWGSTLNGNAYVATVLSETTFSIPVNGTSLGTYTAGSGYLLPNLRNIYVSIVDYPDTYVIPFVNPPQQIVSMTVLWNTISSNYVNPVTIAQLALQPLVDYINSIPVGQPINVFNMNAVFQAAVSNVLPIALLTRLVFSVSVNGIGVSPISGTGEIVGDPESYFYTATSEITINQG